MALPEHAPQIPHIPVPDLKGGLKWAIHHWPAVGGAALTLAGAGVAYQMFFNPDRGSSAPMVDNAPITDTFKPPPSDQGPAVSVNVPPAVSAPPVEQPKINPMDEALKVGKIELATGGVQDYFQSVSKSEAQASNIRVFLFDPRENPNLKIGNDVLTSTDGQKLNSLVIDNIVKVKTVKAPETGTFELSNMGGADVGEPYKMATLIVGSKKYFIYMRKAEIAPGFLWGEKYSVNKGDDLFSINDPSARLPQSVFGGHQMVVFQTGAGPQDSPLANFVGPDGKIPFIDDSPQGK